MQCPNCGQVARDNTRFCGRCGQPLPSAPATGDATASDASASSTEPAPVPETGTDDTSTSGTPNGSAPTPWGAPPASVGSNPPTPPPPAAPPSYGPPPGYGPPAGYGPPPGYGAPQYPPPGSTPPPGGPASPPNPYAPPSTFGPPGSAQYPPPGYGYGYGYGYPAKRTNGLAVASLVLGCVGWLLCGIGSVAALVLGLVARTQIRNSGGQEGGEGLALAGIILGGIFTALTVAYFVVAIVSAASNSS